MKIFSFWRRHKRIIFVLLLLVFGLGATLISLKSPVRVQVPAQITSNPETPSFCFAHVSDAHVDEQFLFRENFKKVINYFNLVIKPPFVVFTGDTATSGNFYSYSKYKTIIATSLSPVYTIPGNHDVDGRFEDFTKVIGPEKFSFDYGGYHFIGMNIANNTNIDYVWFENELKNSPGKNIVLAHLPFSWPVGGDHKSLNLNEANRTKVEGLLKNNGTLVYLSGHLHVPFSTVSQKQNVLDIGAGTTKFKHFRIVCLDNYIVSSSDYSLDSIGESPLVIITSPEEYYGSGNRGQISGGVVLRAKVFSKVSVSRVQYKIDGKSWQPLTGQQNNFWTGVFDANLLTSGVHSLIARVTDINSRYSEHQKNVYVIRGGNPPSPTSSPSPASPTPTTFSPTNIPSPTKMPSPTKTKCELSGGVCCKGDFSCCQKRLPDCYYSGSTCQGCNPGRVAGGNWCCERCTCP